MFQSGLAEPTRLRAPAAGLPIDAMASAAANLVQTVRDTGEAQGALILLEADGADPVVIARAGLIASDTQPPAGPFMLGDGVAWRKADDGLWLVCSCPVEGGAGRLIFGARYPRHATALDDGFSAMLVPALSALASAIGSRREADTRVANYEAALNRSELGILLVSCEGKLLFANTEAERLLGSGEHLRRKGDGISARDLRDAVRLELAIEHVCAEGEAIEEDPVVAIRRPAPLRPLLICVSPTEVESGEGCVAGAVLRIIDPDRDMQPLLEPICAHYRLSLVETRLACRLASGTTLEEAAAALRIKPQTARSYLKQIFLKTDTNRQSGLVRLLLTSRVRALPTRRFRLV